MRQAYDYWQDQPDRAVEPAVAGRSRARAPHARPSHSMCVRGDCRHPRPLAASPARRDTLPVICCVGRPVMPVLCTLYCVLRTVYYALCTTYTMCTMCTTYCVLRTAYCALRTLYYVLCRCVPPWVCVSGWTGRSSRAALAWLGDARPPTRATTDFPKAGVAQTRVPCVAVKDAAPTRASGTSHFLVWY